MAQHPLSLQLYTLRSDVAKNYRQTLQAVAERGYRAVELATLGDYTAAALRKELDTLGLVVSGIHVGLSDLQQRLSGVLDDAEALGTSYIICPWLPPEMRNAESYKQVAASLNQIGQVAKGRNIRLCYHHHDFEFAQIDGTSGFALIESIADASLVGFEIDVYWAAFAGVDPVALIERLGSRVGLVHLKDMSADPSRTFAEVGQGTLDFKTILAACDAAGVDWMIVEQDVCQRPALESVGMSLDYLRTLGRS